MLATTESLFAEFEDAGFVVVHFRGFAVAEVFFFGGELAEVEAEEAVGFLDFIDKNVAGIVAEGSCSDFDLLYVAEVAVFGAHSYGEDGVEEVVEFF